MCLCSNVAWFSISGVVRTRKVTVELSLCPMPLLCAWQLVQRVHSIYLTRQCDRGSILPRSCRR